MTLAHLNKGQRARILDYRQLDSSAGVLMSYGILPGDLVEVLDRSSMAGFYTLRYGDNQMMALRQEMAKNINVEIL